MLPWKLIADPNGYIFKWLLGYSGGLGSIAGVLVADYWLVRKKELRLADLYRRDGVYAYGRAVGTASTRSRDRDRRRGGGKALSHPRRRASASSTRARASTCGHRGDGHRLRARVGRPRREAARRPLRLRVVRRCGRRCARLRAAHAVAREDEAGQHGLTGSRTRQRVAELRFGELLPVRALVSASRRGAALRRAPAPASADACAREPEGAGAGPPPAPASSPSPYRSSRGRASRPEAASAPRPWGSAGGSDEHRASARGTSGSQDERRCDGTRRPKLRRRRDAPDRGRSRRGRSRRGRQRIR